MSGYRPPSTEPRGKWARAIHAKRRSDGMSQTGGFEVLGKRLGLGPKSRAAYVAIDLGLRQPTDAEAAILADWLGGYPSDDMAAPGAAPQPPGVAAYLSRIDSLVKRLAADHKIIVDLVRDLRQSQAERDGLLTAFLAAVQQARENPGGLAPAADPDGEPPAIGPLDAARL